MTNQLQRKIDFAINLLQSIPQDGPIEVCYSGGKDSDVILELTKMAGIPFEAIYKNTTIDPPGTLQHCRENGVRIVQPEKSFYQLVEYAGLPNRWRRLCCNALKEYKIHDRAVLGIRRCESTARMKRYTEPERCRLYKNGEKVRQYLPILEWTDEDVVRFIEQRGIKCHPLYYDADGSFHADRRLGCIGCPMSPKKAVESYKQYPTVLKGILRAMKRRLDTKPCEAWHKHFGGDIYAVIYFQLFTKTMDEFYSTTKSELFPELNLDYKKYLEDYFKIDLTIR